jgi:hypothetical protein
MRKPGKRFITESRNQDPSLYSPILKSKNGEKKKFPFIENAGVLQPGMANAMKTVFTLKNNNRKPLAVLWDMDGVLIDTSPHHFIAWKEAITD